MQTFSFARTRDNVTNRLKSGSRNNYHEVVASNLLGRIFFFFLPFLLFLFLIACLVQFTFLTDREEKHSFDSFQNV